MGAGIASVQLSRARETKQDTMANSNEQNAVGGMLMLLTACCCSSFAGIFMEMLFKHVGVAGQSQEKTSLWLQNMQMATYTMVVLVLIFIYETRQQLATADSFIGLVFRGFTVKAWAVVVINAVGGLLVALVIISAMLYSGVVKMPGDWWNTDPGLCGLTLVPTQTTLQNTNYQEVGTEDVEIASQIPPSAQVVGNCGLDEEVEDIVQRQHSEQRDWQEPTVQPKFDQDVALNKGISIDSS